jgi:formylglycine-generating enzyme required for sulfatase activity
MVHNDIEELHRQIAADPDNDLLQLELIHARTRIEGSQITLDFLQDRESWNQCTAYLQDMAIRAVEDRIGKSYQWLTTETYQCADQAHRIATFEHIPSGYLLNLIPGGAYTMGSSDGNWSSRPAHKVTIKPLLIGRFPLTQKCWDKIGGKDGRDINHPDHPIVETALPVVQDWLVSAKGSLRLSSESEWEYACRAGSTTDFFWGAENDESYCWNALNCYEQAESVQPVAVHFDNRKWNAFGLVDMLGNVYELTLDSWINNYQEGPDTEHPRIHETHNDRAFRGGCWGSMPVDCHSSSRVPRSADERNTSSLGFRFALDLPA